MTGRPASAIKILVVEDDSAKLTALVKVITEVEGIRLPQISEARDAMTAKRLMQRTNFDLLILDIRIPNRIDQLATRDGGLELLREIISRPIFRRPYHIIGITAYDDIHSEAQPAFLEQLWAILKFDPTSENWVRQLRNKVEYLVGSKQVLRHSDGDTYETDLAVITALDSVELDAVKALPASWTDISIPFDSTRYLGGVFREGSNAMSVVAAAAPRMGMSAATATAMKLIHNFRPRYLCMCGIAAGVKGKVEIGDILAPDPSWDWGSGKLEVRDGESRFAPDPYQISIEPEVLAKLRAYARNELFLAEIRSAWPGSKPNNALRLHVGPVASGAAVLADPQVLEAVKDHQRKLVGVDMEIYGVMAAGQSCAKPKPVTFALKSVCDFGDEKKSDEFQPYAAYVSATFVYRFALRELSSEH